MTDDIRKVIAVIEELVPHREDIAFPLVRVWIKAADEFVFNNLASAFPIHGNVFLRVSECENQPLERRQVGLFECVRSKRGYSAHWEVRSTLRTLAQVIDYPVSTAGDKMLDLWRWLEHHTENGRWPILLGESRVYVHRGRGELVGPFLQDDDGRLRAQNPLFRFEDSRIARFDVAGRRHGFVDTSMLSIGKPLIFDPREALTRRLRAVYRKKQVDWLSRDKVQALAAALADVIAAEGSEWINEGSAEALSAISELQAPDETLVSTLLSLPPVSTAVEAAWKERNREEVKKSGDELTKITAKLDDVRTAHRRLEEQNVALEESKVASEAEIARLNSEIERKTEEAARAFDGELKRLTDSPATLAVLGAWKSTKSDDGGGPRVSITEIKSEQDERVDDLHDAIRTNFRRSGLSPMTASEAATATRAAVAVGQPVFFRSTFADVLAAAAAMACGTSPIIAADIPAGVLDPIQWAEFLPTETNRLTLILYGANRSDLGLVLGSLRIPLLRRALGIDIAGLLCFVTLESRDDFRVESEIPGGPIIDDYVLNFDGAKVSSKMCSSSSDDQLSASISAIPREEFLTEIGDDLARLPVMSTSAAESIIYRRAYAAIRARISNTSDARRVFFKYWCLPRLSRSDAIKIIDSHKQEWERDEVLLRLAASEPDSE